MVPSLVLGPENEPLSVAEVRKHLELSVSDGEPAPTAPTVALITPPAAGACTNGAHRVGVTFVTADGETELGPLSDVVMVTDNATNGRIAVSNIALGGAEVTARRLYMTPAAGGAAKLAATIANNTDTAAVLNIADTDLGAEAPTTNTTVDPMLLRLIRAARDRAELETHRALITQTWEVICDAFPCGDDWLELPKPPLQSVVSVSYVDVGGVTRTLTEGIDYLVEAPRGPRCRRGRLLLPYGRQWPSTRRQPNAVTVRFVAGYGDAAGDVPDLLRQAMLIDLGRLFENREEVITGTIVAQLPGGAKAIYRSFKSYPRRAA